MPTPLFKPKNSYPFFPTFKSLLSNSKIPIPLV